MIIIGLLLVGFVLSTYAEQVSKIYFQDTTVAPNCGLATKFADFRFEAPFTATYTLDTNNLRLFSCWDTVLLLPSTKELCNNDISTVLNVRSKLTVNLVAGSI